MKATPIPQESRDMLKHRDMDRCVRCGSRGFDFHHRRSRRVRDAHVHCPCNGITLCRVCHGWAHKHPTEAMAEGYIVSQWEGRPWDVPTRTIWGWQRSLCDGSAVWVPPAKVGLSDGVPVLDM